MKPSDIDWIGDIPDDWDVCRLKRCLTIQNGMDCDNIEQSDGKYPVIGSGGIFGYTDTFVFDGESLLLGRKGTIDKPLFVKGRFWTVDTMFYSKIKEHCFGKFLYYAATTIPFSFYSTNTAVPSMTQRDLNNHMISLPKFEEQQNIANYLDKKSADTDTIIEMALASIEKLKAYKHSLISETVTKGFNRNVKLNPSEISCSKNVSTNWNAKKLKYLVKLLEEKKTVTNGISLENIASFSNTYITTDNKYEGEGISFNKDDVLFGKLRPYLAKVYLCDFCGQALGDFFVMRVKNEITPKFLRYTLLSDYFLKTLESSTYGTKMPRVSWQFTSSLRIVYPDISEQNQISDYLDAKCSQIDFIIKKKQNLIEKLDSYKKSFIFECVTGKHKIQ